MKRDWEYNAEGAPSAERKILYLFLNINSINFSANKSCFGAPRMEWITTNKPYIVFACNDFSFFKFQSLQLNIKRALLFIYHIFVKNRYSKVLFTNNLSCGIDEQKDLINKKISLSFLRAKNHKMPFISNWLPGMLSNYVSTIGFYSKKKINFSRLTKNRLYMHKNKKGLLRLIKFPSVAIFSSSYGRFADAIREASSSGIPTVGIMNSNSNFVTSDFFIPGNDNSYISILYFFSLFNEAILRGYRANLVCINTVFATEKKKRVRRGRRLKRKRRFKRYKGRTKSSRIFRIRRSLKRLRRIFKCTSLLYYGKFINKMRKILKTLKYFFIKSKPLSFFRKRRLKYKRRYARRKRIKRRKNFFFRDDNFYYRHYYRRYRLVDKMRRYIRKDIFVRQFEREARYTFKKGPLFAIIRRLRKTFMKPKVQKYLLFILSKGRKLFFKRRRVYRKFNDFVMSKYSQHMRKRLVFNETVYGKFVWFVHNYDPVRSRRRGFPTDWRNKRHHFFKFSFSFRRDDKFESLDKFRIKSIFYSLYYLLFAKKLLYNGFISLRYH
jgi:ribosomal protein S2